MYCALCALKTNYCPYFTFILNLFFKKLPINHQQNKNFLMSEKLCSITKFIKKKILYRYKQLVGYGGL